MSLDKTTSPLHIKHWPGDMEADYIYTLGVAGERFFKEIKENGRIMGAKCPSCNIFYVPPRIYCEKCFAELGEWTDVGTKGVIHTFTIATVDVDGQKLEKPVIYALIKFAGVCGGLVHKIGETQPEKVKIGMKVEAVFKPSFRRKASINDIEHFKPTK